ncbi:3'(2'),5'-bisphosphate nucleotidase 1-like isoform X3 [Dysidea avara]
MKGFDDPQTEADRQAQRCITTSLSRKFPNITIIGEEDISSQVTDESDAVVVTEETNEVLQMTCPQKYEKIEERQIVVWVDPLDGTKEFTEGFVTHVTVLIGISIEGEAVAGIIHQPFCDDPAQGSGRTIWGMVGLGVYGHVPITLPRTTNAGFCVAITRSHFNELVQGAVDAVNPDHILREGGAGNKYLKVIEKHADAYLYPTKGTKKWDTCAGEAILKALGGTTTDCVGKPIQYLPSQSVHNLSGVLATLQGHQQLLDKIPQEIKARLPQ